MGRQPAYAMALVAAILLAGTASAQDSGTFAGMTCTGLTEAQLDVVEQVYGEPCGVFVQAVEADSLAAKTGVAAGDVLISVRMPEETDFYPIPPDVQDFIDFCGDATPSTEIRLLLLQKRDEGYKQIECRLGTAIGDQPTVAHPEGDQPAGDNPEAEQTEAKECEFVSKEPDKVIATTATGEEMTQRDVDIFGGMMAWSFGTVLTEGQKTVVRDSMRGFWEAASAQDVQVFDQGVRLIPQILPNLTEQQRQVMRQNIALAYLGMAQGMADHPLAKVILTVSASARQVLAGAGTGYELTQQDVDSLLEYLNFQTQMMSGQPMRISPEQHKAFTASVVAQFEQGSEEERKMLAGMDATWGAMRLAWAQQAEAQRQAQVQQWQQAYQQQQPMDPYLEGYLKGEKMYGEMARQNPGGGNTNQATMNIMRDMIHNDHVTSMNIINNMGSGPTTDVYDSGGAWLYNY